MGHRGRSWKPGAGAGQLEVALGLSAWGEGWQTTLWIDLAQEGEKGALLLISVGKGIRIQHLPFSFHPGGTETSEPRAEV